MDSLILPTINAFRNTIDLSGQTRKSAEEQLEQLKRQKEFPRVLLKILSSSEVEASTRQAASIFLKNLVLVHWSRARVESDEIFFSPEEEVFLRENLIDALVYCDHLVQNQIEYMIGLIADMEFPEKWTSLLPKSIQLMTSQDLKSMYAGLTTFQLAIRRFQYIPSGNNKRTPLFKICEDTFPLLLQIFQMLSRESNSLESNILQRRICKIYLYTINYEIPGHLVQPEIFQAWLQQFVQIIQRGMTPQENAKDFDGLVSHPRWLLKKTVSKILNVLYRKASVTRATDYKSSKELNSLFMPKYSIEVMNLLLTELKQINSKYNNLVNQRYHTHLVEYFGRALHFGVTYVQMKPFIQQFFQEIIFPIIQFGERDLDLFENDPHEFLRSQIDASVSTKTKNFNTPRLEAVNFLIDLVGKRGREHLDNIMTFCIQKLSLYQNSPVQERNLYEKEGVFLVISCLSAYLVNTKPYSQNLEQMLVLHVFPELESQIGFIKFRALGVFQEFYAIKFINPQFFSSALTLVLRLMGDKDLAVRTKAGSSLCNLVRVPQGTEAIRPILSQVLDKIFELLSESESDELILAVESIINKYKEEVAPYAINLAKKLALSFIQLMESEKEDEDAGIGSQECLTVFTVLLRAMRNIPEVFNQLEIIIIPILKVLISHDYFFYLEDALVLLTYLTYFPKSISPLCWEMFPQMLQVFDACGCDLISSFVGPIDNYISYGTEHFFSHGQYVQLLINLFKKMVDDPQMDCTDASDACKVMESIIQRGKGRIDPIIQIALESSTKRLLNTDKNNSMSPEFSVYLIEIIANCLIYNPYITVDYLTKNNLIQPVFNLWAKFIKRFQRFYDKKLTVLAFSAILSMSPTPVFIIHGSNVIVPMMMQYVDDMMTIEDNLDKIEEERQERIKTGHASAEDLLEEEDYEEQDDYLSLHQQVDGEEFEFVNIPDNADCEAEDEHDVFLDDLENVTKVTKHFMEGGVDVDLEDEDDEEAQFQEDEDEDQDLFENEQFSEFESPLDDVDGLEIMVNSLQHFYNLNPQLISTSLSAENQIQLKKYSDSLPARKEKLRLEKLKELETIEKKKNKN